MYWFLQFEKFIIKEMASEEKTEKSSPTTSGPDSDIGSVKELPQDEEAGIF